MHGGQDRAFPFLRETIEERCRHTAEVQGKKDAPAEFEELDPQRIAVCGRFVGDELVPFEGLENAEGR